MTVIVQKKSTFKLIDKFTNQAKLFFTKSICWSTFIPAFVQENQQLQADQTIRFINPENSEYYAQIIILPSNFSKVALGQQVLLKFPDYPSQEYGAVKGKITFISHIPTIVVSW